MLSWQSVALIKAGLAGAGAVLCLWHGSEAKRNGSAHSLSLTISLASLGAFGAFAYVNFGEFHGFDRRETVHYYDFYHYFMGGKYFRELGYTGLYDATVIADSELGGKFGSAIPLTTIRDLNRDIRAPMESALDRTDSIKARFTDERWGAFKGDVAFFQRHMPRKTWSPMLQDFGFNCPPVWCLFAGWVANGVSLSTKAHLVALASIDMALLALGFILVGRAFGWRTLCFCLLFFGVNYAHRYYHMSGSFLRHDWLALMLAAISFAKMNRPAAAGSLLALSAMLRIFPVVLFAGPAVVFVRHWLRDRRAPRFEWRFGAAAAATAVLLTALTLVSFRGAAPWRDFAADIVPHSEKLTVKRIAVMYPFIYAGEMDTSDFPQGPGNMWDRYYAWRQGLLERNALAINLVRLAAAALFVWAASRMEAWQALALGVVLIYFLTNPARYYYAHIVCIVPLLVDRQARPGLTAAMALLFCTMICMFAIDLTTRFLAFQQVVISSLLGIVYAIVLILLALPYAEPKANAAEPAA